MNARDLALSGQQNALRPRVLVCLGATAGRAVFGPDFRVMSMRGRFIESAHAPYAFATLHPSALLRLRGAQEKEEAFAQFVADLRLVHKALDA